MNFVTVTKTYTGFPLNSKEILRYAGCKTADSGVMALLDTCLQELQDKLTYKVCYCAVPVEVSGEVCDFGSFKVRSGQLAANLSGCAKAYLFAATVGVEIDRLIHKYSRLSPAKALMLQAIGTERVEALCNAFCTELSHTEQAGLRPRFSPGYGDLPLAVQKDLFAVLECGKRIGLTLNNSLLMSPTKSVTAFVGVCRGNEEI